jgi:hypothetical protein
MTTITIQLPDEQAARLAKYASTQQKSLEELISEVASLIGQPEYEYADKATVDKAIDYVIKKNHELFKRLA